MEPLRQPDSIIAERYRITGVLGRGGIGTTYEAEDLHNSQRVALKELSLRHMSDWKVLELFEREARVLSHLDHPAIPRYRDYFQVDTPDDRYFYLVQERAAGQSLAELVKGGWHADEGEARNLAIQVLEVLAYLHGLIPPVIHRDIKPQNIIRRDDGRLAVVDFGSVQDTYRDTLTRGSTVVGTYGYMAPEQFRGQAVPQTDLYGLGTTLLFLLTHRSPAELPQRKLKIDFRSRVNVSSEFGDWVESVLEPAVEDRFPSAQEALAALRGERRASGVSVQELRRPAGSRIQLLRTGQRLRVEIPPPGWREQSLFLTLFALFWNAFVFFWTYTAIAVGAPFFFVLFSIPFWVIGLSLLGGILYSVVGRMVIEMDQQNFRLQWRLLGLGYQVKGRTADIDRVELSTRYRRNAQPVSAVTIVEGVRTHSFATMIAQREKEWLMEELADFLHKPLPELEPAHSEVHAARPQELP